MKNVPTWAWIALGGVVLVFFFLRRSSASSGGITPLPSDANAAQIAQGETAAKASVLGDVLSYLQDQTNAAAQVSIAQINAAERQAEAAYNYAQVSGAQQTALNQSQINANTSRTQAVIGLIGNALPFIGKFFGGGGGGSGGPPSFGGGSGGSIPSGFPTFSGGDSGGIPDGSSFASESNPLPAPIGSHCKEVSGICLSNPVFCGC